MDAQTHPPAEPTAEHDFQRSLLILSGAVLKLTTELLGMAAIRRDVDELKADVTRLKADTARSAPRHPGEDGATLT